MEQAREEMPCLSPLGNAGIVPVFNEPVIITAYLLSACSMSGT